MLEFLVRFWNVEFRWQRLRWGESHALLVHFHSPSAGSQIPFALRCLSTSWFQNPPNINPTCVENERMVFCPAAVKSAKYEHHAVQTPVQRGHGRHPRGILSAVGSLLFSVPFTICPNISCLRGLFGQEPGIGMNVSSNPRVPAQRSHRKLGAWQFRS